MKRILFAICLFVVCHSVLLAQVTGQTNLNAEDFSYSKQEGYTIPQTAATALLCIYDMSGKQIRSEVIQDRGEVAVSVTSEDLGAGMYLYSLIVDGKLVNTRK